MTPTRNGQTRLVAGAIALVALLSMVAVIALPVVAADPTSPPAAAKSPKPSKAPAEPVTVTGTVATRTGADGTVEYTLASGSSVVVLDAGPSWFFGDDHPLAGSVGKQVTVVGEQRAGSNEVEVETVDGVRLREPGKPPWAGGWKAVGSAHPGWSQEKADRWEAKGAAKAERNAAKAKAHGTECWPPGHCKDKPQKVGPTPTPSAD